MANHVNNLNFSHKTMSTSLQQPNSNEYYNAIRRINYETLVAAAEEESPGLGETFHYLEPDLVSPLKETEERKGATVDMYLHAKNSGVLLGGMPNNPCELDVGCNNDLSSWNKGAGTCCTKVDENALTVSRSTYVVSGAESFNGDDPNGEYTWSPKDNAFIKGQFKIFRNYASSLNSWHLHLSGVEVATTSSANITDLWTISDSNFGAEMAVLAGDRYLFFSGYSTDITEMLNESAYGDEFLFSYGVYEYTGLIYSTSIDTEAPGNNIGTASGDAIGNHRDLPGITLRGLGYRTTTIKFIQEGFDARIGPVIFPVLRCDGLTHLIDITIDANAYQNITDNGVMNIVDSTITPWDWTWNDGAPISEVTNWNLNPHYGCYTIGGDRSVLRGCRFIGWTAGGCSIDTELNTSEQYGSNIYAHYVELIDLLYEEPVDVSFQTPYVSIVNTRFGCSVKNTTVNLPDTANDYWVLGSSGVEASAAATFAFAIHDNTTFENCRAFNCATVFHRDTLGVTGCVMRGSYAENVINGVLFQIASGGDCRECVFEENTFLIRSGNTNKGTGVYIVGSGNSAIKGLKLENNVIVGEAGDEYGFRIFQGNEDLLVEDAVFKYNITGVWSTDNPSTRQIVESLRNDFRSGQVGFDPWNFNSELIDVGDGGTGVATVEEIKTLIGLNTHFVPTSDPEVYGALWNNAGTPAFSAAHANTTAYISAVDLAMGGSVSDEHISLIDRFVRREETAGRDVLHHRLYLPIWGDAAANAIPLWNSANAGSFSGGVTHGSGFVEGDGTGYFNSLSKLDALGITMASGYFWGLMYADHSSTTGSIAGVGGNTINQIIYRESADDVIDIQYGRGSSDVYGDPDNYKRKVLLSPIGVLAMAREGGDLYLANRTANNYEQVYTETRADVGSIDVNPYLFFMAHNNTTAEAPVVPSGHSRAKFGGFGISSGLTPDQSEDFTRNIKELWEGLTGLSLPPR